jgi:hypothetical protein
MTYAIIISWPEPGLEAETTISTKSYLIIPEFKL